MQAKSTKHSLDRNRKAFITARTLILEIPISIDKFSLLILFYGTSKEYVCKYQEGIISFYLIYSFNKLVIDFDLNWDFKVRSHWCTNDFVHSDSF